MTSKVPRRSSTQRSLCTYRDPESRLVASDASAAPSFRSVLTRADRHIVQLSQCVVQMDRDDLETARSRLLWFSNTDQNNEELIATKASLSAPHHADNYQCR